MEDGYGPCLSCKRATLICPTTQKENGLICVDCMLKDRPCKAAKPMPQGYPFPDLWPHMPDAVDWHHELCPKSHRFDKRRTRDNRTRCNLSETKPQSRRA